MADKQIRLPAQECRQIEQGRSLTFSFAGSTIPACAGDTVASALFAHGRRIFSRSFKYHRPRGLLCCSGDCPNCIMEIDGKPNQRACQVQVHQGLQARPQHAWPSLDLDFLHIIEWFDRLLPIGFYYKSLYSRRVLWKVAEPVIRRLAGLGRVRTNNAVEGEYEHRHEYADLVVVGGGPAGLEAARRAAADGLSVMLVDRELQLGGHLRYETRAYEWNGSSHPGYKLAEWMETSLKPHSNIRVLRNASVFGSYEGGLIPVLRGHDLIHIRTRVLVVATGCHQFPQVFRNNDLAGIMLSRATLRLINLFGVLPGKNAVILTTNGEGYATAWECMRAGVAIVAIIDARPTSPLTPHTSELTAAGVEIIPGMTIREAIGSRSVKAVRIGPVDADGQWVNGTERTIACDLAVLSTAWQGNAALLLQSGCQLGFDTDCGQPVPRSFAAGVFAAGEVLGLRNLEDIVHSGSLAGSAASEYLSSGHSEYPDQLQQLVHESRDSCKAFHVSTSTGQKKNFVCLCEDVTEQDLRHGVEEGFDEIETLKRYSTVSMGPCQGRMCSRAAAELCGLATGRDLAAVGTTTVRPPICPVPLGALGGPEFHPLKLTSMHYKHTAFTTEMMDMGVWKRPLVYTSVADEYDAVRNRAGLIDVSTLGKLVVKGKDAPALLDKVYTHWFSNLKPGRVRYGMICDDSGTILDDGTVARLAADHYYITTTTGNVDFVEQWMKWWAAGTDWCVHVLNVTAANAAVNLAGPQAREVLAKLTEVDVSQAAFPYMAARQGNVAGVPALLLRIGFVGETGWEIHFSAEYGEYLWDMLLEAGADVKIRPFGVETQRLLRLEKKHIIVGQDTDALSNPYDSDMSWVVKLDKQDFIGRHALASLQNHHGANCLVGFQSVNGGRPSDGNAVAVGGRLVGRITSVRFSPQVSKYVGLAWVPSELARGGTQIQFLAEGKLHPGVVVDKPFYDPEGTRLK